MGLKSRTFNEFANDVVFALDPDLDPFRSIRFRGADSWCENNLANRPTGIGYEFLGIIGLITFLVTIFCSKSWMRTVTCVAWLVGSVALIFGIRQAIVPASRQRGLLMIACGIVFVGNVLIWTL